jgi:hypothetical protein
MIYFLLKKISAYGQGQFAKAKNVILVVNVFEEQLKQKLVIENIASEEPVPGSAE